LLDHAGVFGAYIGIRRTRGVYRYIVTMAEGARTRENIEKSSKDL
jgi:hypothetical protein